MVHTIEISSKRRSEFIDITHRVEGIVAKSGIRSGVCSIFIPHTTAALTINENADPSVKSDIIDALAKLVPQDGTYDHSEGNSDAHIKSSLLGNEKTIFVEEGRLKLGTWQGVFFCEFDGPRNRQVWMHITSGDKNADKKI